MLGVLFGNGFLVVLLVSRFVIARRAEGRADSGVNATGRG
jgi:hypothetical protein